MSDSVLFSPISKISGLSIGLNVLTYTDSSTCILLLLVMRASSDISGYCFRDTRIRACNSNLHAYKHRFSAYMYNTAMPADTVNSTNNFGSCAVCK
jgi:hypothetical protein